MTIRKWHPAALAYTGFMIVGFAVGLVVNWPVPWRTVLLLGAAWQLFPLSYYVIKGPGTSVTVLPTLVIVRNPFTEHRVPRRLIDHLEIFDNFGLRLIVRGATDKIPLTVYAPVFNRPTARSRRYYLRASEEVSAAFGSVPEQVGMDELERRWRRWPVGLLVLVLAQLAGTAIWAATAS